MQPNQPYVPSPPPAPVNQYDFIMNNGANQQPSSKFGLPSGNSTKQRVLIILGGLFLLVIVGIFLMSLLNSGSKSKSAKLLELAQQQTEIIRVTDSVVDNKAVRNSSTLALANNVSLSVTTTQTQTLAMMNGVKANDKRLALKLNAQTDAKLTSAAQNNQYDAIAIAIIKDELKTYRDLLNTTYETVSKKEDKQVLANAYKGVGLLLGEPSTQQ